MGGNKTCSQCHKECEDYAILLDDTILCLECWKDYGNAEKKRKPKTADKQ